MEGLDDIGLTLRNADEIDAYESHAAGLAPDRVSAYRVDRAPERARASSPRAS